MNKSELPPWLRGELDRFRDGMLRAITTAVQTGDVSPVAGDNITSVFESTIVPYVREQLLGQFGKTPTPSDSSSDATITDVRGDSCSPLPKSDQTDSDCLAALQALEPGIGHAVVDSVRQELVQNPFDVQQLRKLMQAYVLLYNSPVWNTVKALEAVLLANALATVRITHAFEGHPAPSIPGYEVIRYHTMRGRLAPGELEKIKAAALNVEGTRGIVLFELSPRIVIDNEVFHPGRAIVS